MKHTQAASLIAAPFFTLLSFAPALLAHHSTAAEYDINTRAELKGTVTSVSWMNPHSHVIIATADRTSWELELGSPNGLMTDGWTRDALRQGDSVTVAAYPAKDASHRGSVITIVLPDGRTLKNTDRWMRTATPPKQ